MDTSLVIVIILFALIVISFLIVFRQRGKVEIHGPLETSMKMDASNDPPPVAPGLEIESAKSRAGGLIAEDNTGRGAKVKDVDVQDDILVSATPQKEGQNPKV